MGAPHCSHGSISPWPSAASASKMTCASAFLRRPVSGGSARHSSGHAYQSSRTPSAVRQSSKLSGAASVDSAHWQRSHGSVGSKSDRSATIGWRTRTPAGGTMSDRTAIRSPRRSVPIARGRSTPSPPGAGRRRRFFAAGLGKHRRLGHHGKIRQPDFDRRRQDDVLAARRERPSRRDLQPDDARPGPASTV